MRTLIISIVFLLALIGLACGGDSLPSAPDQASQQGSQSQESRDGGEQLSQAGGSSSAVPVGPADVNTVRIGDQTWSRTLPMTTGQCFVQRVQGLPDSGVAWGTLNGDPDLRFSANYNQDGTFEAEVEGDDFYWIAGHRSPSAEDLVIELDFEALTIIGNGTFTNLLNGDEAGGSFHFQCEE